MSHLDAGQKLGQPLDISECVFGLGVVVKVKEGQAIDDGLGDLPSTSLVLQVLVALCGDEARLLPIPLAEPLEDALARQHELLSWIADGTGTMAESEMFAQFVKLLN